MSSFTETAENKALVQASFDRWHAGTGSPFELCSRPTPTGLSSVRLRCRRPIVVRHSWTR
jgi:hypothetical protein